jgi:hypothetical protein
MIGFSVTSAVAVAAIAICFGILLGAVGLGLTYFMIADPKLARWQGVLAVLLFTGFGALAILVGRAIYSLRAVLIVGPDRLQYCLGTQPMWEVFYHEIESVGPTIRKGLLGSEQQFIEIKLRYPEAFRAALPRNSDWYASVARDSFTGSILLPARLASEPADRILEIILTAHQRFLRTVEQAK